MKSKKLNVFILNENLEVAGKLRRYLKKRFGDLLNISLFINSRACISRMYGQTDIVVVDDYLYRHGSRGMSGIEVLKKIKEKDSAVEVVILTSDENVGLAVEAMKMGAKDYILNKPGAWQRLQNIIDKTVSQPIKYLISEFGIPKFVGVFFLTFAVMALIVTFTIRFFAAE